ncbi:hypothetical protein [Sphingomonas colocasiae]|uniref:Uncharacterized protein n=1 Tax=Sphingomonas colocasiae TaxID=1848973 RepID=A0ABS7PN54_9SPHN|nr:hypothetical protein [Sphingomonas colocasiae]MBY8821882.1 hypothetical protein [Sphingomonas colocasiae]
MDRGTARPSTASIMAWLALLIAPMTLAACSQQQMLDTLSSPEDRALAQAAIRDVAAGDQAALARKLPPGAAREVAAAMPRMRAELPDTRTPGMRLVDASFVSTVATGSIPIRRAFLAYEVTGANARALARIEIVRTKELATIANLHVMRIDRPVAELNAFTLSGKSFTHYALLLLAIAAVAVTVAALVRIWRGRVVRRRWLATLGCLAGIGRVSIDWTTGQIFAQPLYVQIFSASAIKQGALGAWIISVSIPAVAIYILIRRKRPHDGKPVDRVLSP